VREKKRFENVLDESVAAGLNAGTDVLMNQVSNGCRLSSVPSLTRFEVEHIIITKTQPREYYPAEGKPLDLGITVGCGEAIRCLELHCKLVKGSTSREVLEVFYQEVGIRLIA
jgi:recyclin-1